MPLYLFYLQFCLHLVQLVAIIQVLLITQYLFKASLSYRLARLYYKQSLRYSSVYMPYMHHADPLEFVFHICPLY